MPATSLTLRVAIAASAALLATACGGDAESDTGAPASATAAKESTPATTPASAENVASESPISTGACFEGETAGQDFRTLDKLAAEYDTTHLDAIKDDPTWADPVDCGQDHRVEVTGVVTLPDDLDAQVTQYADLLNSKSDLYDQVQTSVTGSCSDLNDVFAQVSANEDFDMQVGVATTDDFTTPWNPVPRAEWEAGNRSFACMFVQRQAGTTTAADYMTSAFPEYGRVCFDDKNALVNCDRPHTVERIAVFDMDEAVAAGQLPGDEAREKDHTVDFTDEQWASLDSACQQYMSAVSSHPAPGLEGVAYTFDTVWPADTGYAVFCTVQSPFDVKLKDMVVSDTSAYDG